MKLAALRALVAAIELGSLRNAARSLGVSQPALTKSIRELERELGASLFTRSTTGVAPTAQGKVLYERARAADRELMTAVDEIRQLGGEMIGDLSVGSVPLALILLIPETLRTYTREFPRIRLRVHEEMYVEQLSRLRRGDADVAIGPLPSGIPPGDLVVSPLMSVSMAVVARRGSRHLRARTLADLAEAPWVFTGQAADAGYASHLFAEHGLPAPPAAALANSTLSLLSLILGGDYVGLMAQQICQHPLVAPYMARVPIREGSLVANIVAMARPQTAVLPAVSHFVAHLGRAAQQVARASGARVLEAS